MKNKIIILPFILLLASCRPQQKGYSPQGLTWAGDSINNVPLYGCIYGVRVLDTLTLINGDTATYYTVIIKLPLKKQDKGLGKWYTATDQVIVMQYIKSKWVFERVGAILKQDSLLLKK